jgi:hypothetical protein
MVLTQDLKSGKYSLIYEGSQKKKVNERQLQFILEVMFAVFKIMILDVDVPRCLGDDSVHCRVH